MTQPDFYLALVNYTYHVLGVVSFLYLLYYNPNSNLNLYLNPNPNPKSNPNPNLNPNPNFKKTLNEHVLLTENKGHFTILKIQTELLRF